MGTVCPSATPAQYMVFFFGLYLVALGTGGIKPCVDQYCLDDLGAGRTIDKRCIFFLHSTRCRSCDCKPIFSLPWTTLASGYSFVSCKRTPLCVIYRYCTSWSA
ncbi:uncharacterized protein LOC126729026 [Quercus robur]|uniref:uncharacterized protein LOC126729026 n=1 Tax=Quercus robur TaxID=38942 RepID=UPI0021621D91|nr:uncharacterized protein LOC126729026 [Quercus robur]